MTEATMVPAPVVTPENERFWQGVDNGQFLLARCLTCGTFDLEAQACVQCGSLGREWVEASGLGTVKSFVVFQRAYNDYWATRVPYNVSVITLEEGPELLTNVEDIEQADVRIGLPVRIVCRPRGEHTAPVAIPR